MGSVGVGRHAKEQYAKRINGWRDPLSEKSLNIAERAIRRHLSRSVLVQFPPSEEIRLLLNNDFKAAEYLYDPTAGVVLVKVGDLIVTAYSRKKRDVRFVERSKHHEALT